MSKAYDLKQKSNLSTTASNFKTEPESETSNSADSAIQSAVNIKIEKLEGRQRHVFAKIQIPYPPQPVWQVLTEYEAFAESIPTLTQCRRLESPTEGIRIEEVRTNNFLGIKFSARSVFHIEEEFPHKIHYRLIEGDMKEFYGYWRLERGSLSESKAETDLIFDFFVLPQRIFPMALVEYMLNQNVPANMLAIRQRVADVFGSP